MRGDIWSGRGFRKGDIFYRYIQPILYMLRISNTLGKKGIRNKLKIYVQETKIATKL